MFRIAKNIVKTFEQTVSETVSGNNNKLDAFFQSIPPNLITSQFNIDTNQQDFNLPNNANELISGLRIIFVEEWQLQLQSFFDYIVGINDYPLPMYVNHYGFMYPDYNAILNLLNDSIPSGNIKLNIWSAKGGNYRDEYLTLQQRDENDMDSISLDKPISNTTATGGINTTPMFQSLGIKVQWTPLIASTFTYHILQLNISNGPAQMAGLIPDEDYIIGCQDGLLATGGNELLPDVIRSRTNQSLVLYIYNKISDSVRPITVNIGPDGRLGCNIGYGFLHRIPSVKSTNSIENNNNTQSKISAPISIENSFPPVSDSAFVPSVINPIIPPPPTTTEPTNTIAPPPRSGKKKKHAHSTSNDMNEYFNEGVDPRTYKTTGNTPDVTPPPITQH